MKKIIVGLVLILSFILPIGQVLAGPYRVPKPPVPVIKDIPPSPPHSYR